MEPTTFRKYRMPPQSVYYVTEHTNYILISITKEMI